MLRITELPAKSAIVELKLEGEIVSEWISVIERQCKRSLEEGKSIRLDFSEVRFIDRIGVAMLRRFDSQRVQIVRCPDAIQDFIDGCKRHEQASEPVRSNDGPLGEVRSA